MGVFRQGPHSRSRWCEGPQRGRVAHMRFVYGPALLATAMVLVGVAAPSSAGAAEAYCHPTGDYCTSVAKVRGKRYLRVGTFSFRGSVRMCVTPPRGRRECIRRPLSSGSSFVQASARWSTWFTNHGRGLYRASFYAPSDVDNFQLGPFLYFRR